MNINNHFLIDTAIKNEEDDIFNFKHYAKKVKFLIQNRSANSESFTLGIYGKWGEGKTSFLNLIINEIISDHNTFLYNFNPWRYSTEDEMIFDYFDGLSKRIGIETKTEIQKVGTWIEKYSKYLKFVKSPLSLKGLDISPDELFKTLGEDLKGSEVTIEKIKNIVNDSIKEANFKVIVIIDDLDRLDKNEIYAILKLIKLNANFNNFIFITTLDSEQIAKAIKDRYGSDINDGYSFLEKIINIPIHLPRIEKEDLHYFFELNFEKVLDNLHFITTEEKSQLIRDVSSDLSIGLFKTPREIIRLLNSFFTTAFTIGEEINLKDLFWLEFIKIKNEHCYNFLKNYEQASAFYRDDYKIIDFKEAFIKDPYEKRGEIFEKFYDVKFILEKLFPKREDRNVDPILNNKNQKINSFEHYDKYFSFHIQRKMSNKEFNEIENLIVEKKAEDLNRALQNLFKGKKINKSISRVENLIILINNKDDRDFLFEAIFLNIKHLPKSDEGFLDYKIRLIERIAKILNSDFDEKGNKRDSSLISIKLSRILELNELCYFVGKFYEMSTFKQEMRTILATKTKELMSINPKFYHNRFESPNSSIFYNLSKIDKEYLDVFLEENIENIEDVKFLIRNFTPIWNESIFGGIDKETYNYIKEILNIKILFNKIRIFQVEIIDKIDSNLVIDRYANSTPEQNLEQFIYWYKLENTKQ